MGPPVCANDGEGAHTLPDPQTWTRWCVSVSQSGLDTDTIILYWYPPLFSGRELNFPVAERLNNKGLTDKPQLSFLMFVTEWLNKGLMTVWSPSVGDAGGSGTPAR
eukprot:6701024-Pyramimonas_sp.AAC.2